MADKVHSNGITPATGTIVNKWLCLQVPLISEPSSDRSNSRMPKDAIPNENALLGISFNRASFIKLNSVC